MYSVSLAESAKRELREIDPRVGKRIVAKLHLLESNPRPPGIKKLADEDNVWRLRVGDYRVIYSIFD